MRKAYMTFPDGGRIYRDAAGRLQAYIGVGGKPKRKRVKSALDGERWIAHAFLADNDAFLPGLPPSAREANLRLKWRRETALKAETDPVRRRKLAEEIVLLRTRGHAQVPPELLAELEEAPPGADPGGPAGGEEHGLTRAQERDAFAALELLRAGAPGRTLVDAARALLAAGGRTRRAGAAAGGAAPAARDAVLTLRETARVLVAVYACEPDILEPVVYELFCQADPATALERAARRRKGKPVSNSPTVDKWLKIVRKAEAAAGSAPAPISTKSLGRRTAAALRLAGVPAGPDLLWNTGNAFLWRREVARGNGEDAALKIRLPRRTCENRYSGVDIAPLDLDAFFDLAPFELANRFVAPALAKLRAGEGPLPPADGDRAMGETLRRCAPPADPDWSAAAALARNLASLSPAPPRPAGF